MKYISSIFSTGAVRKTPKRIIKKILSEIDGDGGNGIIEFGSGKGEITAQLRQRSEGKMAKPPYYAFEIDERFAKELQSRLPDVDVISGDAFSFEHLIPDSFRPDYIISSIPLSFYPLTKRIEFIGRLKQRLNQNGKLIVLYHAFWLNSTFNKVIPGFKVRSFATIPPYFLMVYESKRD